MNEVAAFLDRGQFKLDVDCALEGSVTGLFGPSGAGKSTLINVIAGLERPDRGKLVIHGDTLFDSVQRINVPAHRRRIGVVFQEHRLFPHMSVHGNLVYGQKRRGDCEVPQVIDVLDLGNLLRRRVTEISGGERQRVALGRALICQPRMLLLDEPLASLDQRLKRQIIPYLQRVRDVFRVPMVYVSHDLSEILQLTDQLIILEHGRLVGIGRYIDLVHDEKVLPLVHDRGMQNMLPARVVRHDLENASTFLQLGSEIDPTRQLIVPRTDLAPGASVMVSVQPWEIALAAEPVQRVSIQNQLRGSVSRCTLHGGSALVEVDVGVQVIVEISRRSSEALGIVAGQSIVCLIKSRAIRVLVAPCL